MAGKVRKFKSGAIRDDNWGKIRPDLISPYFLKVLAEVMRDGAMKYGDRNWEKGIPDKRILESAERHLLQVKLKEKDEDHLGHLAANIMFLIHNREKRRRAKKH